MNTLTDFRNFVNTTLTPDLEALESQRKRVIFKVALLFSHVVYI
ncbi:MAG: hypothetical protein V1682_04355 [Candidatus Omnitrophota bacterium]